MVIPHRINHAREGVSCLEAAREVITRPVYRWTNRAHDPFGPFPEHPCPFLIPPADGGGDFQGDHRAGDALDFIEDCVHDFSPLEQMDEPREAGEQPDGETGTTRGFFSSGC